MDWNCFIDLMKSKKALRKSLLYKRRQVDILEDMLIKTEDRLYKIANDNTNLREEVRELKKILKIK